jgi:hypothetical protein
MDVSFNHASAKPLATNLIKYLFVITSLVLVIPVLADDKRTVIDVCSSEYKKNNMLLHLTQVDFKGV